MKQIMTLMDLDTAARNRKSVFIPGLPLSKRFLCFGGPKPAAFVLSMQAAIVIRLIRLGMFVYEPAANKPPWKKERKK